MSDFRIEVSFLSVVTSSRSWLLTVGFLCFTSRSAVYTNKNRFSFCYIIYFNSTVSYMVIGYWFSIDQIVDWYGDQVLICVLIQLLILILFQIKLIWGVIVRDIIHHISPPTFILCVFGYLISVCVVHPLFICLGGYWYSHLNSFVIRLSCLAMSVIFKS